MLGYNLAYGLPSGCYPHWSGCKRESNHEKTEAIYLLPIILITALIAGCATPSAYNGIPLDGRVLPDDTVLPSEPSVTYDQAIALAQSANRKGAPNGKALPEIVEFRDCPGCPVMVALDKNFAIGKYEVTQAQWQAIMGYNPADFISPNRPVEQVNWNDIQQFIKKLNQKTGKQYRLPTEVEWSRACYAGSQTEYCGSDDIDAVAWYYVTSG